MSEATNQNDSPDLPPNLAELAAVAAARDAALDGAAALPGAPEAAPEPVSNRPEELAALVSMGVMMAAPALPFIPKCYTPEVCTQIGTALDAVATKYGWNIDNIMSPELALACVALPPTFQAVVMGREFFALRRAELAQREQAARLEQARGPQQGGHGGDVQQPGVSGPG